MAEEHKTHSEHKEIHHKTKIKKMVVWQWLTVILAVLFVASIFTGGFKGAVTAQKISAKAAAEKAVDYINTNLLQQGMAATLKSVSEKNGVYDIKISIAGREYDSYITVDGSLLFPSSFDIDKKIEVPAETQTPQEIPKTAKPKVDIYVMSFCPYGNKAEDTMLPVYKSLKDNVEWNVHYIVSVIGENIKSLHGQIETDEDMREVCVKKNYGIDKFWQFITYINKNCGSDGSCWKEAAKEIGINTDKVQECYDKEGIELMKKEAEAANSAGVGSSPTLIINGIESNAVYQYGDSEAYKTAICSAFSDAPEECSGEKLSSSSSQTASAAGSCG